MVSKKTTMAVCSAVMASASILASVPAYAETRQDVIAVTPGDEKLAVLFEFPTEVVDSTLISPSGKRYDLDSPDVIGHMDEEQRWRNYCVENAEAGPWSVEYDLKSNDCCYWNDKRCGNLPAVAEKKIEVESRKEPGAFCLGSRFKY